MTRFIVWMAMISLLLALLRFALALGLIVFAMGMLWALWKRPAETLSCLMFFASLSIAKAQPITATVALAIGILIWWLSLEETKV